jgi:endonuclease/exonuclease/phosphatase family metal-dependent hydrolase
VTGDGTLRVISANLEEGGLDRSGPADRWERSMAALAAWEPDVVCVQEMAALRDPRMLSRHLWATANRLAMIPLLGSEGGTSGNHPAVLVSPRQLAIIDYGPPPRGPGHDPAWCEALLQVRGGPAVRVYSVHLPPRSAAEQLAHAQRLAGTVAQRGELAVIGGDWNCWSPDGPLPDLAAVPAHLHAARMRLNPGRPPAANYDVHRTLDAVGLVDTAAALDPARRTPPGLADTGRGGGRVDRFYVTGELWDSGAVLSYAQQDGGGSDHQFIALGIATAAIASAAAPGFRP